jgi:TetR/AcrR family transcriptional regulator
MDETTRVDRPARKRNPEDTRRRILDAAERAFALRGFAGARLRDIAQEAGVHHALVHHYYDDKLGLFEQVLERGLSRISTAGMQTLSEPQGVEGSIRAFVSVLFDFCANNRSLLRIVDSAFRDADAVSFGLAERVVTTIAGPLLNTLRGSVEQAQRTGHVRKDIPASALIHLGFGAIVARFVLADSLLESLGVSKHGEHTIDEERDYAVRYILGTMLAKKP